MSVYALPGRLFPPARSSSVAPDISVSSSTFRSSEDKRKDLSSDFKRFPLVDSLLDVHSMAKVHNHSGGDCSQHGELPKQELTVTVTKFDIDSDILLSSLVGKAPSAPKPSAVCCNCANKIHIFGVGNLREKRRRQKQQVWSCEDAVEFELSISMGGRKYTAKRSLNCLKNLYADLVDEARDNSGSNDDSFGPVLMSDDSGGSHEDSSYGVSFNTPRASPQTKIPKFPTMCGESGETDFGMVIRSFAMMHDVVQRYRLSLQRWLMEVSKVVSCDSSTTWANFLWEPLSGRVHCLETHESFNSITSIQEQESEE